MKAFNWFFKFREAFLANQLSVIILFTKERKYKRYNFKWGHINVFYHLLRQLF